MRFKNIRHSLLPKRPMILFTFFCLAIVFLGGCATKPWTVPLAEEDYAATAGLLDEMALRDSDCEKTVEADLRIFYTSPLGKKGLEGYFLFSPPGSYKFVITNPFGQTMWAIAGHQRVYHIIEPLRRQYTGGSLSSFGVRNDLPSFFLKGEWAAWITARNRYTSDMITAIRNDRKNRGVWITLPKDRTRGYIDHILLNQEQALITERILTSDTESKLATISYSEYEKIGECYQPHSIEVSGLGYGTEIRLQLDNVALQEEIKNYTLPIPQGYFRRYLP